MTDLLAEEYKGCRDLFLENVRAMERNEIYSLGAIGAVMVYAVSATDPRIAIPSSLIPLAISVIGKMRYIGFGITAGSLNSYIQKLEAEHDDIGWTTFQRANATGSYLRKSRFLLWRWLFWGSAVFAVLVISQALISTFGLPPFRLLS